MDFPELPPSLTHTASLLTLQQQQLSRDASENQHYQQLHDIINSSMSEERSDVRRLPASQSSEASCPCPAGIVDAIAHITHSHAALTGENTALKAEIARLHAVIGKLHVKLKEHGDVSDYVPSSLVSQHSHQQQRRRPRQHVDIQSVPIVQTRSPTIIDNQTAAAALHAPIESRTRSISEAEILLRDDNSQTTPAPAPKRLRIQLNSQTVAATDSANNAEHNGALSLPFVADTVDDTNAGEWLDRAKAFRRAGNAHFLHQRYTAAINDYNQATKLLRAMLSSPSVSLTWMTTARSELPTLLASRIPALMKTKSFIDARADVDELLTVKGEWHKSHSLSAALLDFEGRTEEAVLAYDRALTAVKSEKDRAKLLAKRDVIQKKIVGNTLVAAEVANDRDELLTQDQLHLTATVAAAANEHDVQLHLPLSPAPKNSSPSSIASPISAQQHFVATRDYSVFPRITNEALKDLVGGEILEKSQSVRETIQRIKVTKYEFRGEKHRELPALPVKVVLHAQWHGSQHSSKRKRESDSDSNNISSSYSHDLRVEFEGDRVCDWQCHCESSRAHVAVPCVHVTAALLQLQHKQQSLSLSSSHPSLFQHADHALSAEQWARSALLYDNYQSLSSTKLQSLLATNGLSSSGIKSVLIARCIDANVRGVPSPCPSCNGRVFYANGWYHCKGRFDPNAKRVQYCEWKGETVQLTPWRDDTG